MADEILFVHANDEFTIGELLDQDALHRNTASECDCSKHAVIPPDLAYRQKLEQHAAHSNSFLS